MIDQAAVLKEMVAKRREGQYARMEKERLHKQTILSIASGKGGVGKTTLAVNLGILMAGYGKKVLIFDADLGLSNVNILLGVVPKHHLLHVFRGEKRLEEIISSTRYGVDIISGGTGFDELANLTSEERMLLIQQMNALDEYDDIIIDVGAGISETVLSFLKVADHTIVVTTPEPTAITDAYGMIKCMALKTQIPNVQLVINRCRSVEDARTVATKIISIAKKYLNISIEVLGMVFQEETISEALYEQMPHVIYERNLKTRSNGYRSMEAIVGRLLDRTEMHGVETMNPNEKKNGKKNVGLMQRFFGIFLKDEIK